MEVLSLWFVAISLEIQFYLLFSPCHSVSHVCVDCHETPNKLGSFSVDSCCQGLCQCCLRILPCCSEDVRNVHYGRVSTLRTKVAGCLDLYHLIILLLYSNENGLWLILQLRCHRIGGDRRQSTWECHESGCCLGRLFHHNGGDNEIREAGITLIGWSGVFHFNILTLIRRHSCCSRQQDTLSLSVVMWLKRWVSTVLVELYSLIQRNLEIVWRNIL